jgi:hypothetical protein
LLPLTDKGDAASEKTASVVRALFQTFYEAYMAPLLGLPEFDGKGSDHKAKIWRQGSLAVIMLDLVTDRKKVPKKGKKEKEKAAAEQENAVADKLSGNKEFSLGFLDKAQWRHLRLLMQEPGLSHLIVVSEFAFVPLSPIPVVAIEVSDVPKGHVLPWQPTLQDLDVFFSLAFQWLTPKTGPGDRRHMVLMCGDPVPYATTIQLQKTGSRIIQLCPGNLGTGPRAQPAQARGDQGVADTAPIDYPADMLTQGKIGGARYSHRLRDLDNILIDSTRNVTPTPPAQVPIRSGDGGAGSSGQQSVTTSFLDGASGVAKLRIWFDSWKALGSYAFDCRAPSICPEPGDAVLLVGPVLGTMREFESELDDFIDAKFDTPFQADPATLEDAAGDGTEAMAKEVTELELPVLVEVDRDTTLEWEIYNSFEAQRICLRTEIPRGRPYVVNLGPLVKHCRYNVNIRSGLKYTPYSSFEFSTHYSDSDANTVFLNCDTVPEQPICSDFLKVRVNPSPFRPLLHRNPNQT